MNNSELHKVLQEAINKKVLKVNAGSTGSIFSIDIGDKLIKEKSDGNTSSKGECVLMVYCAWRLYDILSQKPITGWHENSELHDL